MVRRRAVVGWTDLFLLAIIILNIIDFFEVITTELDYVKKIVSWTLLGYLLLQASPTKVFFGSRRRRLDAGIIISYFLLIGKELVWYAGSTDQGGLLEAFFSFLMRHAAMIQQVTFTAGMLSLLVLGLYVALRVRFHKRSIMGVLHEEGDPKPSRLVERYLMTMLVLLGFFVMVFNMMMEWLAIAVDATILLVALLFWSVVLIRHKVSLHAFLDRVGNIGSDFYQWFIDHFRYRETLLLGIVGLLVLHLLTDVGVFLVPYLTGVHDPFYLSAIQLRFQSVWQVFSHDWSLLSAWWQQASYLVVFSFNIVGYLLLFVSPAVIWKHLYHRRNPSLPRRLLVPFMGSLPAIALSSLFHLGRLRGEGLAGVDVQLRSLIAGHAFPLLVPASLCLLFLVGAWALSRRARGHRRLSQLWTATSVVFFSSYIATYFVDVASFQQGVILRLASEGMFFFATSLFIFQGLLVLFYAGGLLLLFYELSHRTSHG